MHARYVLWGFISLLIMLVAGAVARVALVRRRAQERALLALWEREFRAAEERKAHRQEERLAARARRERERQRAREYRAAQGLPPTGPAV